MQMRKLGSNATGASGYNNIGGGQPTLTQEEYGGRYTLPPQTLENGVIYTGQWKDGGLKDGQGK